MGAILIFILLAVLLVVFLVLFIQYKKFKKYLIKSFKNCCCMVYGPKGYGKDIVFQYVINNRKDFYYSNIPYGKKYKIISLADCSVEPNTYENFICGNYVKTKHKFYEGKDIYISDIGNIAPAQYDSILHKRYPSLPIFQSLSRHLYDSNFHCNAQSLERPWKPIREQSDFYVRCRGTKKLFGFIFITFVTTYEKYESAKKVLFPLKKIHFNKFAKADFQRYYAENGDIRNGYIINFKWNLKYDTRIFEKYLLKGRRKYYHK